MAAIALTQNDIDQLRWAASVVDENKLIFIRCKEVRTKCPRCETKFVARKEIKHEVRLPELEEAAGVIYRIVAKAGRGGASLWFGKGGG